MYRLIKYIYSGRFLQMVGFNYISLQISPKLHKNWALSKDVKLCSFKLSDIMKSTPLKILWNYSKLFHNISKGVFFIIIIKSRLSHSNLLNKDSAKTFCASVLLLDDVDAHLFAIIYNRAL